MMAPSFTGSRRWLWLVTGALFATLALVFMGAPSMATEAGPRLQSQVDAAQKISPALRTQFRDSPQAKIRYLLVLSKQADIENDIVDWNAKGRFVYEQLRRTADATQPPVAAFLGDQVKAGNVESFKSYYIINAFQVRGNLASAEALARLSAVGRVATFPQVTLDPPVAVADAPDAVNAVEWNVAMVKAPEAWALGYNGAGITVGSLDTGARHTHNAIVGKYRGNLGGGDFDHNYNWWAAVGTSPVPTDTNGHGTHTIGTIVGDDGAGNQVGVAPGARWIASNGIADATDTVSGTDVIEAGEFMLAPWNLTGNRATADPSKRPHVVSNSWGWDISVPYPLCSDVEFFHDVVIAWRAAGIFPSFSAGNSFPQGNRPPAAYPETFETGALRNPFNLGGLKQKASYSSEGPSCYDGGQHPQIVAGGGDQGAFNSDFVRSSYWRGNNDYAYLAGTSMAQPATAGAVAILKQVNPNLSISQTWYILTSTAEFSLEMNQCGPRPNICYGYGMLRIDEAVKAVTQTVGTATPTVTGTPPTSTPTLTPSITRTPRPTNTATPAPACVLTQMSTDVPKTTVDLVTITSTLTITNGPTIARLEVISLTLEHTYASDLDVFLVSPAGTRVELFTDVCADQAWGPGETGFTLDDRAPFSVSEACPPGQGRYQPEDALSKLLGQSSNGRWTLEVRDDAATDSVGTLRSWGLRIGGNDNCPAGPSPTSTGTAIGTATATRTSTATSTATQTSTAILTSTATNTATAANTATATSTAMSTTPPSATATASRTPAATNTSTPPAVSTATRTPVLSPTTTRTAPPGSPTHTATRGPTITPQPTRTATPTSTPSLTATPGGVTSTPTVTPTPCTISFSDVGVGDYFYEGVRYLTCAGAISGYNDNTFRPYNEATRGQLVKIVVIAEAFPIATPATPTFRDVPADHPFFSWIETAAARQIISGYGDGTFRPYNPVTRGQIAKIIVVAEDWGLVDPVEATFTDVPPGNPFYVFIETAHLQGVISGYADGTFRWYNNATRGQIAKIVHLAVTRP